MTRSQFNLAVIAACLLVLGLSLKSILAMEHTIAHGTPVLLELAPVDPRSLMQGDYMALRFAIDRDLPGAPEMAHVPRYAYVRLDEQGRASLHSTGDTLPAPAGLVAIRLRLDDWHLSIGPNAFFFQEGKGGIYADAHWGELRVAADGTALLAALRAADLALLGEQRW